MTATCPTCRQALATPSLVVDFATNQVIYRDQKVRLTGREAEALFALLEATPRYVSHDLLEMKVAGRRRGIVSEKWSRSLLLRLGKKLEPLPFQLDRNRALGARITAKETVVVGDA